MERHPWRPIAIWEQMVADGHKSPMFSEVNMKVTTQIMVLYSQILTEAYWDWDHINWMPRISYWMPKSLDTLNHLTIQDSMTPLKMFGMQTSAVQSQAMFWTTF